MISILTFQAEYFRLVDGKIAQINTWKSYLQASDGIISKCIKALDIRVNDGWQNFVTKEERKTFFYLA